MKLYIISDNVDTMVGMRLAGIEGCVVHEKNELIEKLDSVFMDKEIGIVLITELLFKKFPDIIYNIKLNKRYPLLVEIPDRHGSGKPENFITSYISEAIGLNLE